MNIALSQTGAPQFVSRLWTRRNSLIPGDLFMQKTV
jgi:hypothetical protein